VKPKRGYVVYLVHWPDIAVMKAGVSCQKRWRAFVQRGAEIVDLVPCDDPADAYELESVVHAGLIGSGLAFRSAAEAVPYLGGNGGGYRECFRVPDGMTPMEILQSVDWLTV
jgi:hypothetical protein